MLSKKGFGGGGQTTLIQDQEQTRNLDPRIHVPGFVRFNLQFHSPNAVTFSTVSTLLRHHEVIRRSPLCEVDRTTFAHSNASPADRLIGPTALAGLQSALNCTKDTRVLSTALSKVTHTQLLYGKLAWKQR